MIYNGTKYKGKIQDQGNPKDKIPKQDCYVILHYNSEQNRDMALWELGYFRGHWLEPEWFVYDRKKQEYVETKEPDLWIQYEQ